MQKRVKSLIEVDGKLVIGEKLNCEAKELMQLCEECVNLIKFNKALEYLKFFKAFKICN